MLVEWLIWYLNERLRIMTNKWDSTQVALEAILLLIYAWDLCPAPGTDISRSMVVVRREFSFPINFSTSKHAELYSAPGTVKSYARDLASQLSSCRKIAELLVKEQQCWHHELVNCCWCNPLIFPLATSYLLDVPPVPIPNADGSINWCILSHDPGGLLLPFQVHCTSLSLLAIQNNAKRSMHPISRPIPQNLFLFSQWMGRTKTNTASYINQLGIHLTRKPG